MAYKDIIPFIWYAPKLLDNFKKDVVVDLLVKRYDSKTDKFKYVRLRDQEGSYSYQNPRPQDDMSYYFEDLSGRIVAWMYTGERETYDTPIIADTILTQRIEDE